jgi:hypothetical protein
LTARSVPRHRCLFTRTRRPSARLSSRSWLSPPSVREPNTAHQLLQCNTTRRHIRGSPIPGYALTQLRATNPMKDPPARNRPMRKCIQTMRSSPMLRHSRTPSSSAALPRPWMGYPVQNDQPRPCFSAHPAKGTPRPQVRCLPPLPPGMTSRFPREGPCLSRFVVALRCCNLCERHAFATALSRRP